MRKVKPMPMVPNMNMINPMQNYYMGVKIIILGQTLNALANYF